MIIDVSEGGCDRGRRSLAGLEAGGRISTRSPRFIIRLSFSKTMRISPDRNKSHIRHDYESSKRRCLALVHAKQLKMTLLLLVPPLLMCRSYI